MSTKSRSYKKRYEKDFEDDESPKANTEPKIRRIQSRNWRKWVEEHEYELEEELSKDSY